MYIESKKTESIGSLIDCVICSNFFHFRCITHEKEIDQFICLDCQRLRHRSNIAPFTWEDYFQKLYGNDMQYEKLLPSSPRESLFLYDDLQDGKISKESYDFWSEKFTSPELLAERADTFMEDFLRPRLEAQRKRRALELITENNNQAAGPSNESAKNTANTTKKTKATTKKSKGNAKKSKGTTKKNKKKKV